MLLLSPFYRQRHQGLDPCCRCWEVGSRPGRSRNGWLTVSSRLRASPGQAGSGMPGPARQRFFSVGRIKNHPQCAPDFAPDSTQPGSAVPTPNRLLLLPGPAVSPHTLVRPFPWLHLPFPFPFIAYSSQVQHLSQGVTFPKKLVQSSEGPLLPLEIPAQETLGS